MENLTSSSSSEFLEATEPGGPGQSLPVAGIFALCAASLQTDPKWLRPYLLRALSSASGLKLPSGARNAVIEQAIEISDSPKTSSRVVEAMNAYLCASTLVENQAVPLLASLLQSDVVSSTSYDARSREVLLRFVTALRLPPRVLYNAEALLAVLVQSITENARTTDGTNIEAVGEDESQSNRRRGMKWLKIGTAGVVGGIALGLSGGLIAPALIPALTTIGMSAPITALGSSGVLAVGGIFGAAGASVGAAAMASRTGVVNEFCFEPCTAGANAERDSTYKKLRVTPKQRTCDVIVPWGDETLQGESAGGLLVWELLTSQEHVMVVPGLISFAVGHREFSGSDKIEWLLPKEKMEVGGMDKDRIGEGKRRRSTGAITVQGRGEFVLRFQLMPGSLPVNVSYRTTVVPPGKDPPLWIMDENEQENQDLVTGDMRSLSYTILVPGLLSTAENGPYPGMCADQFIATATALDEFGIQCFALRWDSDLLMELSNAMRKMIGRMALTMATQRGVLALPAMAGVAGVVGAAMLPVSILAAIRTIIGNIWARTISHAEECGYMLAAELASRSFGNRPVVLVGYSAGATVVFNCLKELARRNLVGIVHEAYLIGSPCTADVNAWREIRTVVAGRLVNVYNPHDWYLELYHRSSNLGSVAGTRPIKDPKGIANISNFCIDKEFITNHTDYATRCSEILLKVGVGNAEHRRVWKSLAVFEKLSDDEDEQNAENKGKVNGDSFDLENDSPDDSIDDVVLYKAKGLGAT